MKHTFLLLGVLSLLLACEPQTGPTIAMKAPVPLGRPVYTLEVQEVEKPPVLTPKPPVSPPTGQSSDKGCPSPIRNQLNTASNSLQANRAALKGAAAGSDEYKGIQASLKEDEAHLRNLIQRYRSEGYTCPWPQL